jgi:hypothetical protein
MVLLVPKTIWPGLKILGHYLYQHTGDLLKKMSKKKKQLSQANAVRLGTSANITLTIIS